MIIETEEFSDAEEMAVDIVKLCNGETMANSLIALCSSIVFLIANKARDEEHGRAALGDVLALIERSYEQTTQKRMN